MIKLTVPWEEFRMKLESYIQEVLSFDPIPKTEELLNQRIFDYRNLRKEIQDYIVESLENDEFYSRNFFWGNGQKYVIPNAQAVPITKRIQDFRTEIRVDSENLEIIRDMISVCDLIVRKDEIDLNVRKNYTAADTLNLLLNKLFDLYDDHYYQVLPILEGNGISLNRMREEFEFVQILETNGFVTSSGIANYANARLTLHGKLHVENQRTVQATDYSSISNDKEELFNKLDEILQEVEKNNLGSEILFEEMQELKFAYEKLNKKSWGQLFKMKLYDLILGQVINEDVAKRIFEEVANLPLYLR